MKRSLPELSRRVVPLTVSACIAALLAACAAPMENYPAAPKAVQSSDHQYKIGSLDNLSVFVWRHPELSTTVSVRPDGRISTPLAEDLVAAGRSPAQLAREIESRLAKVVRDPVVTVVVTGFQGALSEQIRIVGEAARPQAVPYRQDMTILDVMIQAGGLTDFANGNGAVLVRNSEGGKHYRVRLKDLLKRGDVSANVAVRPGDVIIVPQSWF
ncbi:XrtA/PEP-CTERM system exopolysaccharide export protein [Caldimonas tepidiphila]|uniref:XrtA/PEP-CTERM system exopolysaccharide export protein n=1 Tax=Caldimonas tepidiphila TaxID=2315841 RepID=UPI000E5A73FB|nr:XrtA/PEP-CTERM system exopolysaccharide export protein [Caldimonas tepidiphila]